MHEKVKIAYILPFYEEGTDTHLFYNYELIKMAARLEDIDINLIIEKCPKQGLGQIKQDLGIKNIYVQKYKSPPFRFLELFLLCFKLRSQGCTNFYVHYSYYGALAAWIVNTIWFWNFASKNRLSLPRNKSELNSAARAHTYDFYPRSSKTRVFYWNRGMPWLFKRGWIEEKVFRFILKHTILVTGPESLAKEYRARYGVKDYRALSNWVDVARFQTPLSSRHEALQDTDIFLLKNSSCPACRHAGRSQSRSQVLAKLVPLPMIEWFENKRIILFVHHLSKRKGADLIPEIAKGFGDDVVFLVAGDGPERENLELAAIEQKNIGVLGKISNSAIPDLFRAADVFLMPSREEGSPHVILETMASGVPFVASDVGGVRELVPRELEAFLCTSEDVKCFQEKIKTLLSDNELYNNTGKSCLGYAKKFDISRGVEEFAGLFV